MLVDQVSQTKRPFSKQLGGCLFQVTRRRSNEFGGQNFSWVLAPQPRAKSLGTSIDDRRWENSSCGVYSMEISSYFTRSSTDSLSSTIRQWTDAVAHVTANFLQAVLSCARSMISFLFVGDWASPAGHVTKFRMHNGLQNRPFARCVPGSTFLSERVIAVIEETWVNSQPRLMHFSSSDWFTQPRLSAHIP